MLCKVLNCKTETVHLETLDFEFTYFVCDLKCNNGVELKDVRFTKTALGEWTKGLSTEEILSQAVGKTVYHVADSVYNRFQRRLEKLGIKVSLSGNVPWVYLDTVNNHDVIETLHANHGYCIGFIQSSGHKEQMKFRKDAFTMVRNMLSFKYRTKTRFKRFIDKIEGNHYE